MTVRARYRFSVVAALVLFSILALAGFLYSPWHVHSRLAASPCPFTAFEHNAYAGESGGPLVLPPAPDAFPLDAAAEPLRPGAVAPERRAVRGPPA